MRLDELDTLLQSVDSIVIGDRRVPYEALIAKLRALDEERVHWPGFYAPRIDLVEGKRVARFPGLGIGAFPGA
jgi:hypothetical protein